MAKSEIMGSREVGGNNKGKTGVKLFVCDRGETDIDVIGFTEFDDQETGIHARKFVNWKVQPRWLGSLYLLIEYFQSATKHSKATDTATQTQTATLTLTKTDTATGGSPGTTKTDTNTLSSTSTLTKTITATE